MLQVSGTWNSPQGHHAPPKAGRKRPVAFVGLMFLATVRSIPWNGVGCAVRRPAGALLEEAGRFRRAAARTGAAAEGGDGRGRTEAGQPGADGLGLLCSAAARRLWGRTDQPSPCPLHCDLSTRALFLACPIPCGAHCRPSGFLSQCFSLLALPSDAFLAVPSRCLAPNAFLQVVCEHWCQRNA